MELRAETVEELADRLYERSKGQVHPDAASIKQTTVTLRLREREKWMLEQIAEHMGQTKSSLGGSLLTAAIIQFTHALAYKEEDPETRERFKQLARDVGAVVHD